MQKRTGELENGDDRKAAPPASPRLRPSKADIEKIRRKYEGLVIPGQLVLGESEQE